MSARPEVLMYTRDADLTRRVQGYLHSAANVRVVESRLALAEHLARATGRVVLLDLQTDGVARELADVLEEWPRAVLVAFALPGSDPALDAEACGVYAVEDRAADRSRVCALVARALAYQRLRDEVEQLRRESVQTASRTAPDRAVADPATPLAARHFPGARRDFADIDELLQGLVEDVGASLLVSRAGLFCRVRGEHAYRLRAALRCMPDTRTLVYDPGHPLVQWLALHAHVVTRGNLDHVAEAASARLLRDTLDQLGAEVIVPLQFRDRILGWLFVGHRSTGLPYEAAHLENLILVADLVSTLLENALLYEEMTVQKTLAETLLHTMPSGIVAAGPDGVVRWINQAARDVLQLGTEEFVGQPAERLGSMLADGLRRALRQEKQDQPREWVDGRTHRRFSVLTRCLMHEQTCLGAVALLQDRTLEWQVLAKQERVERAAFWTELAASMSHEIRNPLVAIKTFAQLLPERYQDSEFRNEFSSLVSGEVDRLNGIIDQINEFAHPPALQFAALNVAGALQHSLEKIRAEGAAGGIRVDTRIDSSLPSVWGDARALEDCFAHVLRNAVEALAGREGAALTVSARAVGRDGAAGLVLVAIHDNGAGVPPDLAAKVFSPFCTSKARGLGLGLPIAKRTVVDHNGTVQIESDEHGTTVTIALPVARQDGEEDQG